MRAMSGFHDSSSETLAPSASARLGGAERAGGDSPACGGGGEARAADPLSDVLQTVRLRGATFFFWDVSWPFASSVPDGSELAPVLLPSAQQVVSYHVLTQGTCWGGLIGERPVHLEAGDILLIPHGSAYVMSSSADLCATARPGASAELDFFRRLAAGELGYTIKDGGRDETETNVICGFLSCDERPFNPAMAALPSLVRLRRPADPVADRLRTLIDMALAEAQRPSPGSHCVLLRLSELLFVEVVRRCLLQRDAASRGWLAGLSDPVVGHVLLLFHRQPAHPWTLDELARAAGASRSKLADAFTSLVGTPPMRYLAQWRMQLAARRLADANEKVEAVAGEVGYASVAAFSRAFKRCAGVSPAEWRSQARAGRRDSDAP
jgi:AraC-like DNA-binding protein